MKCLQLQVKTKPDIYFTCSPSTEGSVSVITLKVSAIFLFLPLFFAVNDSLSTLERKKKIDAMCLLKIVKPASEHLKLVSYKMMLLLCEKHKLNFHISIFGYIGGLTCCFGVL